MREIKLKKEIMLRESEFVDTANRYLLVDLEKGKAYSLNKTSFLIIKSLQEGKSVEEIIREMSKLFEKDIKSIRSAVQKHIDTLRTLGLIC